jgi:hypothetical protein
LRWDSEKYLRSYSLILGSSRGTTTTASLPAFCSHTGVLSSSTWKCLVLFLFTLPRGSIERRARRLSVATFAPSSAVLTVRLCDATGDVQSGGQKRGSTHSLAPRIYFRDRRSCEGCAGGNREARKGVLLKPDGCLGNRFLFFFWFGSIPFLSSVLLPPLLCTYKRGSCWKRERGSSGSDVGFRPHHHQCWEREKKTFYFVYVADEEGWVG